MQAPDGFRSAVPQSDVDGKIMSYHEKLVPNGAQGDEAFFYSDLARIGGVDRSGTFPLAVKVISLRRGTRTIPVAHSQSDTFAYILKGSGTCWIDGHTYEIGHNDCLGVAGGSGSAFSFISERQDIANDKDDIMEILLVFEKRGGNRLHYPLSSKEDFLTWKNPPKVDMGLHNGRISSPKTGDSVFEHPNPPPHPFWPSKIFHSRVMVMPNMTEPPFAHELGILSLLMSLSGRISVSQRVLPEYMCSSPPTAHSAKTFLYVAVEGRGRLWKDGVTEPFEQGQFFAVQGGTGTLYCIFNEEKDDFIYLEIEHICTEDRIFRLPADEAAKRKAADAGEAWWEDPPKHQLGEESYIPLERSGEEETFQMNF